MFGTTAPLLAMAIIGSRWLVRATSVATTCQARLTSTDAPDLDGRRLGERETSPGTVGSFCEGTFTLQSDGTKPDILIIDHGVNVGGLPTFQVLSRSGDTSVFEVTYSETRALLDNYMVCSSVHLSLGGALLLSAHSKYSLICII